MSPRYVARPARGGYVVWDTRRDREVGGGPPYESEEQAQAAACQDNELVAQIELRREQYRLWKRETTVYGK